MEREKKSVFSVISVPIYLMLERRKKRHPPPPQGELLGRENAQEWLGASQELQVRELVFVMPSRLGKDDRNAPKSSLWGLFLWGGAEPRAPGSRSEGNRQQQAPGEGRKWPG